MSTTATTDTQALYRRFPHLIRIELLWGSLECRQLLSSLLTDDRGGQRAGFPPQYARTILALLMEHDEAFPQYECGFGQSVWYDAYQRNGLR